VISEAVRTTAMTLLFVLTVGAVLSPFLLRLTR
jgi:hypothetical protein